MSGGPSLSEYFTSDAPSMFDEIGANKLSDGSVLMPTIQSNLETDILLLPHKMMAAVETNVPNEVRDTWKTSSVDASIPPLLTMPGVQTSVELSDPIKNAVIYLLGETEANQRHILTADDVTADESGIRQLIELGCFRAAANLTGRCLTTYGQGYGRAGQPTRHSPHSLQLWFTRFALLIKLGELDLCKREAEAFGLLERPDLYYEFYPEIHKGRKGSMASFAFRLLLGKLPSCLGSHKIALDRLTDMLMICTEIKEYFTADGNKVAGQFWEKREQIVLCALINCSLAMKDFSLADFLMEKLTLLPSLDAETRRILYSAWGRIYLQCGDVFGAEKKFSEARRIRVVNTGEPDVRDFIDKGLIAVAQNDFKEAHAFFQKAMAVDATNTLVLNNMGVCLLYLGRQKEAIGMFEQAIAANTPKGFSEGVLLNLCTLYELESSNDVSKKLALLKQINRHKADLNLNIEYCLKLPTGNKL